MHDWPTTAAGPHRADPVRRARPAWALARGGPATARRAGRDATESVGESLAGLLAHLRVAVMRYARGLHARGVRPEQVRVRVEALVAAALAAESDDDSAAARRLTAQVVRWSHAANVAIAEGR